MQRAFSDWTDCQPFGLIIATRGILTVLRITRVSNWHKADALCRMINGRRLFLKKYSWRRGMRLYKSLRGVLTAAFIPTMGRR
ncbi:hypothetical protein LFL96_34380 [Paraburkholderia sp. D15]|uniref:hypothetical protein n=1 Tax=Paraburkholderia sp. D15 TaxID=2880218 RepID=UPI0024783710|nr:hypothetical protein [Paraburkholderia sp. D15]WGS53253.1 hypothetical protein LFL96_34380 [Paraburkholderia sp. D15]